MDKNNLLLYFITDASSLSVIESAIQGGVTMVQLRMKNVSTRDYCDKAARVKEICDGYGVPFIINDRVDVAQAVDASGVHLGQEDISVCIARKILGREKIIGATAKTIKQALTAQNEGADYLGVGAVYPSSTKNTAVMTGAYMVREIKNAVNIPVVAIGGLTASNIYVLNGMGIDGIAVSAALANARDPLESAKELIMCLKCF